MSEGSCPTVPELVLTQCVRQDWGNCTQKGTMVLPMGTLERGKTSLVEYLGLDVMDLRVPREGVQRPCVWS